MKATKANWYYRLKFSPPGRWFTRLRHPSLKKLRTNARTYYHSILGDRKGLVFDIGANVGEMTRVFSDMGMEVVACEPDPANFSELKARFRGCKNIHTLPIALAKNEGVSDLFSSPLHGGCLSTLSAKRKTELEHRPEGSHISFGTGTSVPTQTLDQLISTYGLPLLIKIDVEGYEEEVLSALSQMVPFICFEANLPGFREETIRCLQMISSLDPEVRFNCSDNETSLLLPEYLPYAAFLKWFEQQGEPGFDIVCKAGDQATVMDVSR